MTSEGGEPRQNARQRVASELRALRKRPGPLDAAKLTSAPAIIRAFGGGDPNTALIRLIDIGREFGDREIDAALGSMGHGLESVPLLDRLSEYGERHFVDARTVRRWSDSGIQKLAQLVIGRSPWVQPRLRQILIADDRGVKLALDLRVPANLRMHAPEVSVNGRPLEIAMPPVQHVASGQRLQSGLEDLAAVADLPLDLRLRWYGEKYPVYISTTCGNPAVIFSSRITYMEMRTSVWVASSGGALSAEETSQREIA